MCKFCQLSTVNCQPPTVNYQNPTMKIEKTKKAEMVKSPYSCKKESLQ